MDGWCGRCQKRCGLVYLLGPGLGFGLRLCRGEVEGEGAAGQWGAGGGVRDVDREGGCGGDGNRVVSSVWQALAWKKNV